MSLQNDLQELVEAGVITGETADKIKTYYGHKAPSGNRLYAVFGILGAILVGLGVILMIAHNWDDLSKTWRTFFSLLPLVLGQLFCLYVLLKQRESTGWREGAATFLTLAIGASISLISQTYHISGSFSSFMLTWVVLSLPLVYVLNSSVSSLLYIIGITSYAVEVNYNEYHGATNYNYWILLIGILPHYYYLYAKKPFSNSATFHHYFVPISLSVVLASVSHDAGMLLVLNYITLFSLFTLIGSGPYFQKQPLRNNGYFNFGMIGSLAILMALSFHEFWEELRDDGYGFSKIIPSQEFTALVIIIVLALALLLYRWKRYGRAALFPMNLLFVVFIPVFFLGMYSPISQLLTNLIILGIGVMTAMAGAEKDHLGIVNLGLIIILILATCRFFDDDLTFVIRGAIFLVTGIAFFATNFWMIRRRKHAG